MPNPTPTPVSHAVIGAGFSGIAVAVQLLRRLRNPSTVVLVNRNQRFGRGLAYGTRSGSHLLNVPAGRMSVDPDDHTDFVRFLKRQGHRYGAGDFVPRKLYGEYLESTLERAQADAAAGVELRLVQAEVQALDLAEEPSVLLRLGDGRALLADHVVMAWGNFAPQWPCPVPGAEGCPVIQDPWAPAALECIAPDADVLLVGSSLTAYDVALALLDRDHRGSISMLSRRGLLPQGHRRNEHRPHAGIVTEEALANLGGARHHLRSVRELAETAGRHGHDWRDVFGELRPHLPHLWSQLTARDRGQFLRHLLPYWDTHRHRAAPEIDQRIRSAIEAGRLRVMAGRLTQVRAGQGRMDIRWRPRGAEQARAASADVLVNCTGPTSDLRRAGDRLVVDMLERGLLQPDALRLGLEIDEEYRLVRADGGSMERVRYVGPLLKARYWEATAVPELREHAARIARLLAAASDGMVPRSCRDRNR